MCHTHTSLWQRPSHFAYLSILLQKENTQIQLGFEIRQWLRSHRLPSGLSFATCLKKAQGSFGICPQMCVYCLIPSLWPFWEWAGYWWRALKQSLCSGIFEGMSLNVLYCPTPVDREGWSCLSSYHDSISSNSCFVFAAQILLKLIRNQIWWSPYFWWLH